MKDTAVLLKSKNDRNDIAKARCFGKTIITRRLKPEPRGMKSYNVPNYLC